jgi:flavin reductase (DIM6/NTAB) family NADH-FMN oxidoreductase RutF
MSTPVEITPKRKALRSLTYGLYIVSVKHEDTYWAAIVTWLSQASFEPSQIMMALRTDGRLFPLIKACGKFAVNLPASDQKERVAKFFKGCTVSDMAINGWPFREGQSGAPLFEHASYYLECELRNIIKGTDHQIVMAEIMEGIEGTGQAALTLSETGWKYGG